MNKEEFETFLNQVFSEQTFISAILTDPFSTESPKKIMIRPLEMKGKIFYQFTENRASQVFHCNLSLADCLQFFLDNQGHFKQLFFYTAEADYHLLCNKKKMMTLLRKKPSKQSTVVTHNRPKNHLIKEGEIYPFLVALEMMNAEGKIYAKKRDKFYQMNRFLEIVADILPDLDKTQPLHIIDFGCGKAYLTFALHYFLTQQGYRVHLTGLDLKTEVIKNCQTLAQQLKLSDAFSFIEGDINTYQPTQPVDLMVALHACDTATDAALEKAIRWQAKVILCVPCCQHELFKQIQQETLQPLLKHGLLKERLTALVTDAARVQLLDVLGYQAQIIEFIDPEHTPKNALIRAVRRPKEGPTQAAWQSYQIFKQTLNIYPSLERRFKNELQNLDS